MGEANAKRARAAQCRQAAERSSSASDRAFFRGQALRLDHQAKELERLRLEDEHVESIG
jgi:hypothetical protein